jgi:hypothetical protein
VKNKARTTMEDRINSVEGTVGLTAVNGKVGSAVGLRCGMFRATCWTGFSSSSSDETTSVRLPHHSRNLVQNTHRTGRLEACPTSPANLPFTPRSFLL